MLPSEYYYMTGLPVKLSHDLGEIHQPKLFDFMENDITIEEFAQPFVQGLTQLILVTVEN